MKVICVKKNIMSPITVGKIYDIIEERFEQGFLYGSLYFISDNGDELLYFPSDKDLMPLEHWRENQLKKVGI